MSLALWPIAKITASVSILVFGQITAFIFPFSISKSVALVLNKTLSRVLNVHKKIGVTLSQSGLFIPMKSMLGIIGIGKSQQKSCMSCVRKESCELRKGGQRCYVKD